MDLEYEIIYSKRKTITLSVKRDRSIIVRAPMGTSEESIRKAVEAKKLWLFEKIRYKKYPSQPVHKEFITGESILYLGRHYRLQLTDELFEGIRFQSRFYISRRLYNKT